ncbi:MAG TPA: molybdenum cofactor biosynthesis protein MoaE [Mycobacteriales bacterium]|nr:molybdenum cofactor biosynthesis protein MoaE [Mycobacteriales bacterium]
MTELLRTGGVRLVEIRSTVLSVDEVIAAVSGPELGGAVMFLGTVRNEDHGRAVRRLDYSAHPSADTELARVAGEVAADAPAVALAALHRVGELDVGEIAVVVGAAAPHRDEAFRVGRVLIDRIKAEVPLWKRQSFADGAHEWVGACD